MGLFNMIFNKKPIQTYSDFWQWFQLNEKKFYKSLKHEGDINKVFFDKLAPKLNELKDGYWFLAGMFDDDTAELIITADGMIKNIVFVEELVDAAPEMKNWKITALKQPTLDNSYSIELDGYSFDETTMMFYPNEITNCPDEIDITIAHKDLDDENRTSIISGVYLALENSLGELNFATSIDSLNVISYEEAQSELIHIEKLKSYLTWREKEFIEKYKGLIHNTEDDNYSGMKFKLKNGREIIASVNSDLLKWDKKGSHPWIVVLRFKYNGEENEGMPNTEIYKFLDHIEDEIMLQLKDSEGYLNIGRQTGDNLRELFIACSEFRKPSKELYKIQNKYSNKIDFNFEIFKDKYWQTFDKFSAN
ncbi:DUF695 domain-containing protein [uncultured Lacinutrix sp.]|uniref:DUF695 domain-containing protein n=1 Tax=uncultured Lacinutrix sp. TaxID=574032 RepID=UPI0026179731|nr:DUF695 domain-containing protein [uncultured Lacinutrix sp.]